MHKTINGWTKERMKAQIRLRNNGEKSVNESGLCQYRNKYGNCCAVGCFIPDEIYFEEMDRNSFNVPELLTIAPSLQLPLDPNGMNCMQQTHDNCRESYYPDMRVYLCNWIDKNVEDGK